MTCHTHPRLLLPGLVLLCLLALPGLAQRTLNHGIHAVPAPARVNIDGVLDEWDTSGAIVCCKNVESMLATESVRIAAMWDSDNLYLAFDFRDTTPMQNKIDPVTMPGNGWRSDSIQVRMAMADFVSHLDAWYYTTEKRSAMTMHYGRYGVADGGQPQVNRPIYPEKLGAQQAFRLSPDGQGYIQEIRLPWAVITLDGKMPARGADLRTGFEVFWGDETAQGWPRSRVTDNLADGETQTDFFWTNVKAWGKLILEDKNNLQLPPASWLKAQPTAPQGPVPITFTLPRDSYVTIAIEDANGNRVKSLLGGVPMSRGKQTIYWSGLDDRNQPLPAGRYHWVGLYRDKLNLHWLMDFYQPNARCPWPNAKGTGAWGPDHGTLLTAAAGDGRVFLSGQGSEGGYPFFATNEVGQKLWSAKSGEPDHLAVVDHTVYGYTTTGDINWLGITPRGVMQFDAGTGSWLDIKKPDGTLTRRLDLLDPKETSIGFAADRKGIYLSIKDKGIIRVFSRETFTALRTYTVPGAGELFATNDGRLLIVTPTALQELTLDTGKLRTLVEEDLSIARAITADAGGRIYLAMGAPFHQVYIYEQQGRTAVKRATLGKMGGRTRNGWYDPREGFYNPCGLAVDGSRQLWVVEQGYKPKRVSVWKNGQWQRDFIGDTFYGGGGVINPLDPTMAFYRDMQFTINIATGEWALKQIGMVLPKNAADFEITYPEDRPEFFTGYIIPYQGRAYLFNDKPRQIFRQREDGRWVLCVHLDSEKKLGWIDRNDDEQVQDSEVVRGGAQETWGSMDYWGQRPSQNLDMFFANGDHGLRLRLQGLTPKGTPLYDFTKFETMSGECQNGIGLRDGSYNSGCAGERGEYFSEMRKIYPPGINKRTFWFRGENTGRWTYRMPAPGLVLYPFQAHGAIDVPAIKSEVVCWVSDFGQRYLFTDDMLLIDQLFMDARGNWESWPQEPERGFLANHMAPGQETFNGFLTRLKDGRCLLTTGGTDCRVFEVTGLDSLRRMEGSIELKPEDLVRAQAIQQFNATGGKGPVSMAIAKAERTITVDGKISVWPTANTLQITVDDQRNAQVSTMYDEKNLYVAWDVRDNSPMLNQAKRLEMAFKGGDAVDLMLRLPGEKLDDPTVHAGDLRLLVTEFEGKSRAVLYRPISKGQKPYTFDAFEGAQRPNAVRMDEVREASEVQTAILKRDDGYVVEALIPWTLLGVTPQAGLEGRIDFGVLFSDPGGMQTMIRAYWSNKDTNIVVDIPSEARLQPGNWGVFTLGE